MAKKPKAQDWTVKEQIIDDPASGLMIQFETGADGLPRLRIFGELPFGNREFIFDPEGVEAGAGTVTVGACRPSWLREV